MKDGKWVLKLYFAAMELKKLTVHNYKSLVNFELNEPNAFTVFAGPNGAGKSNIFEAIEFEAYNSIASLVDIEGFFGGRKAIMNFNARESAYRIDVHFDKFLKYIASFDLMLDTLSTGFEFDAVKAGKIGGDEQKIMSPILKKYEKNFLRLFINSPKYIRIHYTSDEKLLPDASNLESVLKRILKDESIKEEFLEWLDLFIPGFSNIEIHSDNIGGTDTLLIYEEGTIKPFTKNLISDGTYNILALLTAVYQTNEPQFLCIEEPENGLNPYVVRTLAEFFRNQCKEKGHVIWLNTHSQTLVKALRPEELILVDKENGETKIKQFSKDHKLYSLDMDEAWLSNALGGGLPW